MLFNCPVVSVNTTYGSLFAVGNTSLLSGPCISVAGSRNIDSSSTEWLQDMLRSVRNHSVVSGLALGADAVAHQTALDLGLPTIAVLPSGFSRIAPRQHVGLARRIVASGGLLLSAYSPTTSACRQHYIDRNRIIAGLGKLLIVPQCNIKSGTMHTVRFAKDLNKPIFVRQASYSGNSYIINSLGGYPK